jgi:hypothetical protein
MQILAYKRAYIPEMPQKQGIDKIQKQGELQKAWVIGAGMIIPY